MLELKPFFAAVSVIVVSELGDKTFFIAAIMAMTHSRLTVFLAAISALIVMTLLSVFLGLSTTIIPHSFTHYASILLFFAFGIKMLWDARSMSGDEAEEEYQEVQKSLAEKTKKTTDRNGEMDASSLFIDNMTADPETGVIVANYSVSIGTRFKRRLMRFISLVFLETFTMTFLAEWGDRSQITTIILGAKDDPYSVFLGAIFGHAICTTIAVVAGRFVAQRISARTVTIIGGVIFLIFAFTSLAFGETD